MHDTAYKIAKAFFDVYLEAGNHRILEVGSYDVGGDWSPGKIRDLAPEGSRYIGVDIEAGPNVDLVVEPGGKLPFDDGTFDAVIASSVFEHDPAFWLTFLELCRVTRPGGHIYINAPSNGMFHQFPVDNWRFYPDAGLALVSWAKRSDVSLCLSESFIAERDNDIWNDFCAIFCRAEQEALPPPLRIADIVRCANVRRGGREGVERFRPETEDMLIIKATLANNGSKTLVQGSEAGLAEQLARLELLNEELQRELA